MLAWVVSGAVLALSCAGCSQLFGLDSPSRAPGDAADDGVVAEDALIDMAPADVGTDAKPTPFVRRISIASAGVTGGPHTDFALLFSATTTWLRGTTSGGNVANSGLDIYFSSDQAGANRLAHEVEAYTSSTGTLIAWVKIPSLSGATVLYIHYGDTSITTSQENRTGTWNSGYELVMHLTGTPTDATTKNALTNNGSTGSGTGKVGDAVAFNGSTSAIGGGSANTIDDLFNGGGSLEGWIRPSSFGEASLGRIMEKDNVDGWLWMVDDVNNADIMSFYHSANSVDGRWQAPASSIVLNTWQHVAVVYDKVNTPVMYINGAQVAVLTSTPPTGGLADDSASALMVGNSETADRTFDGLLDELRLSSVSRSAGWFATQYANHNAPASFYTISNPL